MFFTTLALLESLGLIYCLQRSSLEVCTFYLPCVPFKYIPLATLPKLVRQNSNVLLIMK